MSIIRHITIAVEWLCSWVSARVRSLLPQKWAIQARHPRCLRRVAGNSHWGPHASISISLPFSLHITLIYHKHNATCYENGGASCGHGCASVLPIFMDPWCGWLGSLARFILRFLVVFLEEVPAVSCMWNVYEVRIVCVWFPFPDPFIIWMYDCTCVVCMTARCVKLFVLL